MLHIAAVALEGVRLPGAAAEVRFVAQAPAAQVDAVAQAQVVGDAGLGIAGAAAGVELIVHERRRHPCVPQLRVDVAAQAAFHGDLRDAGGQAQVTRVVAQAGLVNQCGQVVAGQGGIQAPLCLELVHVDTQLLEQFQGQAGFHPPSLWVAVEFDVTPAYQHFVAVQVYPVVARQHAVGRQQHLQVDRRLRALQKGGVEALQVGGVLRRCKAGQRGADDQ
ncbi:hypothetical protein D3C79_265890 [compost metagenome]